MNACFNQSTNISDKSTITQSGTSIHSVSVTHCTFQTVELNLSILQNVVYTRTSKNDTVVKVVIFISHNGYVITTIDLIKPKTTSCQKRLLERN